MAVKLLLSLAALTGVALGGLHLIAAKKDRAAEAAHPPRGSFVDVGDVKVHYREQGNGPTLVILHGAGGNLNEFDAMARQLSQHFRVLRFDRPGLGYTSLPKPYGPWWRNTAPSPREQARLLAAASDQLGAERIILMGQSFGGSVALAWALERPEQVAALVPVSAASQVWEGGLDPVYPTASSPLGALTFNALSAAVSTPTTLAPLVAKVFEPQPVPTGYMDMLGIGLTVRRASFRANARQVNSLKANLAEMAPDYPGLSLPVEIVHGEADTIVPFDVHALPLSSQIPEANLTRLPGVGHMPHHAQPETVRDAIYRASVRAGLHQAEDLGIVVP